MVAAATLTIEMQDVVSLHKRSCLIFESVNVAPSFSCALVQLFTTQVQLLSH